MKLATEERIEEEAVRAGNRSARLGGTDIFRGALVIVTAIVIGGFVISRGLDQGEPTDQVSTPETTVVDEGAGGDLGPDTTLIDDEQVMSPADGVESEADGAAGVEAEALPDSTVPEAPSLRPPAEVKVLVLNGAQTQGIAARGTEALLAASYQTAAPKNAATQRPSAVLFAESYQAEALAVAAVFGTGLEGLVQPLDPADLPIDDTQEANVIVVIGPDNLIPIQ